MKRIICLIALACFLSGCATTGSPILTSKEEMWYIPTGTTFQAKKEPSESLKTYQAQDDLMVLYKGKYLELERQANANVIR